MLEWPYSSKKKKKKANKKGIWACEDSGLFSNLLSCASF